MTVFAYLVVLGMVVVAVAGLQRLWPEVIVGAVATLVGLALIAPRARIRTATPARR